MIKSNKPSRATPTRAKRNNGEGLEQKLFFDWLKLAKPMARALTFAIPNGGKRDELVGFILKQQGVTAGVPDVYMAVPTDFYPGLFIEFKYGSNKLTGVQQVFIARLREAGYRVDVCYSFEEARNVVLEYLKGSEYD